MKKILKRVLIIIGIILLLVIAVVAGLFIYSQTYSIPEQDATIENTTGLVQAHDRSLYDAEGNRIQLKGVNAGQILLQEGWMSPFALEPLKNEDGSYVKDADGNIQYPEFTEEEFREGIKSNPNLNTYDIEELMSIYWNCFFTEEDFRIIKEELQMNTIRLPFYYLNILNEDLTLKSEEDAFVYLDWFMGMAAKYELYVVLDLHGAPGSQNGYEHSGAAERVAGLWTSEENIQATVELWDFVSKHYTEDKPELGKWIATYDIMNEPTYGYEGVTTKECWDVFDQIYDVIRENGDQHVITMEGCWDFGKLPNPADYAWENVQYEYHGITGGLMCYHMMCYICTMISTILVRTTMFLYLLENLHYLKTKKLGQKSCSYSMTEIIHGQFGITRLLSQAGGLLHGVCIPVS